MGIFRDLFFKKPQNTADLGRNEQCWCGSGKKYKQCHFENDKRKRAAELARQCKVG
jgi:uncharacterized protein YecA (UPF0149 family)